LNSRQRGDFTRKSLFFIGFVVFLKKQADVRRSGWLKFKMDFQGKHLDLFASKDYLSIQ
jgi:hypothetical protein